MPKPRFEIVVPRCVARADSVRRLGISPRAIAALAGLLAVFAIPLYELGRFALGSDLYSYILLIPAISAYVVWSERRRLTGGDAPNRPVAIALLAAGLGALLASAAARGLGQEFVREDRLAISTLAAIASLAGTCAWFLPGSVMRRLAFPLGFLVFAAPIPTAAMREIEIFMQHGSAAVAHALFDAVGTSVFYQDLLFHLPGIHLHVAPECSGIRSTLVLLIVSVLTGYFFLQSPWRRTMLAVAILPVALARNGFRIFVIGELCVRMGPEMIDSIIHRRGGPVFFALSLIPLFLLLLLLQRRERRARRRRPAPLAA